MLPLRRRSFVRSARKSFGEAAAGISLNARFSKTAQREGRNEMAREGGGGTEASIFELLTMHLSSPWFAVLQCCLAIPLTPPLFYTQYS